MYFRSVPVTDIMNTEEMLCCKFRIVVNIDIGKRYWVAAVPGNWSDAANWALYTGGPNSAGVPLSSHTVVFDGGSWAAIFGLGLGPVGLAFYVWDIGVKKGDIQLLGTASYAAPLLSTLCLVIAGITPPSATLALAACLITAGALVAARASVNANRSGSSGG